MLSSPRYLTSILYSQKRERLTENSVLACDSVLSKQIAAFAPVSGAFYQSTVPCQPTSTNIQCVPGREKIPFLEFHGTINSPKSSPCNNLTHFPLSSSPLISTREKSWNANADMIFIGGNDTTIDYFGGARKGACLPAITYFIQSWAMRNGISTVFTSNLTALDTIVYTYGTGSDTGLVSHVFDTNIGHDWPSTQNNVCKIYFPYLPTWKKLPGTHFEMNNRKLWWKFS